MRISRFGARVRSRREDGKLRASPYLRRLLTFLSWRYELKDKAGTNSMHLEWFSARVRVLQQRVESVEAKGEAGRILEVLGDAMRDVQVYAGGYGQGFGDAFVEIAARRRI